MSSGACPFCGRAYTADGDARRTRDHIMPVAWGGSLGNYGVGIVNRRHRWMCARCNNIRGAVGHCVGALVCVLTVSVSTGWRPETVARRWRMSKVPRKMSGKRMKQWLRDAGLAPRP